MNESVAVGFYLHISYWLNIERLISCWKEHNVKTTIYFQVTTSQSYKVLWRPNNKQPAAIFKLFFADAINWMFLYLFLLASLEY